MKGTFKEMKTILFSTILNLIISLATYGQNNLSVSVPTIWSSFKIKDNWTPPTAPNYKEYLNGTAFGYGVNLNYSFRPTILTKNDHILMNLGVGYFQQRFDIIRPFDYASLLKILFHTDHYIYRCLNLSIGLTYKVQLSRNYFLTSTLFYYRLKSFRQDYTPIYGFPSQINHKKIDFGDMLNLAIGINKNLGKNFSIGLCVLTPMYTRWRNDKIFKDDPSTFSQPSFSLGSSISVAYHFEK